MMALWGSENRRVASLYKTTALAAAGTLPASWLIDSECSMPLLAQVATLAYPVGLEASRLAFCSLNNFNKLNETDSNNFEFKCDKQDKFVVYRCYSGIELNITQADPSDLNRTDSKGNSLLLACLSDDQVKNDRVEIDYDFLELLVSYHKVDIEIKDFGERTALYQSYMVGAKLEWIKTLLDSGADVNAKSEGRSLIWQAIDKEDPKMLELLLDEKYEAKITETKNYEDNEL